MKELLVLRHAKSSWKQPGIEDHERPLNKRGERDAPRIGALIHHEGIVPDRVVCSTALRARTTAETVAAACGYDDVVLPMPELYLSGAEAYALAAAIHGGDVGRVMVVGHNPDVEDLVLGLTGMHETMPTAALARIEIAIDGWAELTLRSVGRLVDLWRPKEL